MEDTPFKQENQSGNDFKIFTIPDKMPSDVLKGKGCQLVSIQIYLLKSFIIYFFWENKL